jgi:AcrR family transcriptional regulator
MPSTTAASPSTRHAILDRAVDLASTEGLEGLTLGRLATELRMSKSGVFAHFGSKQDLQLATVQAATERFVANVIQPAQEADEGVARLRRYCDLYLGHLEAGGFPGGCFWAAAAAEFDDRPGPVRDAVRGGVQAWLRELADQARLGGLPEPDQVAFDLWAAGLAANAYGRLLGDGQAFTRARRAIEERLTR